MATTKKEFEVKHGLVVAAATGSTSVDTGSLVVRGGGGIAENLYIGGDLSVNSGNITTAALTVNIGNTASVSSETNIAVAATASGNTKTVNIATGGDPGSSTNVNLGSIEGGTTVLSSPTTVVSGTLIVSGTTTTVNSSTLTVDDKTIELGAVTVGPVSNTGTVGNISGSDPWTATITGMTSTAGLIAGSELAATDGTGSIGTGGSYIVTSINSATSVTFTATSGTAPIEGTISEITTTGATEITADGGGIVLKGATDKTLSWVGSTQRWTFNNPVEATSLQNTAIGSEDESTGRFTTVESTVVTGTAPFTVASTTVVNNLNADLLDGNHSSAFYAFGTVVLDTTDSDYTWSNDDASSVGANSLSDTLYVVQGDGITVSTDDANDAIRISHADTSSADNLSATSGQFVNSLTFDSFGHVTSYSTGSATSYSLDGESPEANSVNLQLVGADDTVDAINIIGSGGTTVSWDEEAQKITIASVSVSGVFDDTSTNETYYPLLSSITSGSISNFTISTTKLYFNPFTGDLTATNINSLSDISFKENVNTIPNGLTVVEQLRPVEFVWKDTKEKAYGVIAQEIEKVLPEVVQTNPGTGIKTVSYNQVIPFLIKSIQELTEEINLLKSKNT